MKTYEVTITVQLVELDPARRSEHILEYLERESARMAKHVASESSTTAVSQPVVVLVEQP